jgi:DNA-binding transcriptional MerR regulator
MKKEELIASYEAGDLGMVEFTELALEAGMTLEEIGKVLEDGQDVF